MTLIKTKWAQIEFVVQLVGVCSAIKLFNIIESRHVELIHE